MIPTARRRWSTDFKGEIDGIAIGESGPVFLHGYDPPAGGKWIDNVIPGKLTAVDRNSGALMWTSPCEVGYGRGFGSGFGENGEVVILGPSIRGHRIARMSGETGELIGASEIEAFDQAIVAPDMCLTVTPGRVAGIMTSAMIEVWAYSRDGERYHFVGRDGERALVVYTNTNQRRQGILSIEVESGEFIDWFLEPTIPVIHDFVVGEGLVVLLSGDREPARPGTVPGPERVSLVAYSTRGSSPHELWREVVAEVARDEMPDVSLTCDSGKLYVARGAMLSIRDALSGRSLGELAMPGLDERIAWSVSQGAGLLAEETRASIYELPA